MIRIAIVDDHALLRAGLSQFLAEHVDLRVVVECRNASEALDVARQELVDVMLLDISMPGQTGIDVLHALKLRAPAMAVLILSSFPEEHYATRVLRDGAAGYLAKDCEPEEIVKAVRIASQGRRYITAAFAERLASRLTGGNNKTLHEHLSKRELQVFLRLARGQKVGEVALSMSLSVKTISTYRARLMEKLALTSNSDLTYYALKNGLIQ